MGKIRYPFVLLLISIITLLSACNQEVDRSVKDNHQMTVLASFYTMYEFTKQIAQDKADVQLFLPAQISPHHWEPAPKDLKKIQKADLFIYSSEYFETWINDIEKSVQNSPTRFVNASEGITLLKEEKSHNDAEDRHHEHQWDPHVWLNPVLAQKLVANIAEALIEQDPDHASDYKKNRDAYIQQLQRLDQEYRNTLSKVKHKEFITQHAAFGYLAYEYDLREISIAGLSPSLEPSPAQLAKIKKVIQQQGVKTIFVDELSNSDLARTLAKETGIQVETLSTLEGLTAEQQKLGLSYIDLMRQNLRTLEQALK